MGGANPLNWEDTAKASKPDLGYKRDVGMDLLNARLAATGLDLTGATSPAIVVASSVARIRWAAGASAGIRFSFNLGGEYAPRQGSASAARYPDFLAFRLIMLGGAVASQGNVFNPLLHRVRAGVANSVGITPSGVRQGLTIAALELTQPNTNTTFSLTASPAQAEIIEVIFAGKGLLPGDALQFDIVPNGLTLESQSELFGISRREIVHAGLYNTKDR